MQILKTIADMRQATTAARLASNAPIGLVPTMGALHEGHLSLVRAASQQCGTVVVSIFVNPTQFAPGEDLDRYPRTLEADLALLEQEGVDLVFVPSAREMYPNGIAATIVSTHVEVPEISDRLDGLSRPGHFRAVATVVAKLFHIVGPDLAFFGAKDAVQVAVLRAMVRDLDFPLRIVVCPTVRDADGLALSSRNSFLTPQERTHALTLSRALETARLIASHGSPTAEALREAMLSLLHGDLGVRVDYAEVVHPDTLEPLAHIRDGALLAVAAWVGETRLIDNLLLSPPTLPSPPTLKPARTEAHA
ncbi:pantoate--beta-alanine ligase [Granulicella tundricola]|uniref:Pantothenate synthetase n=1 Tax=Granulicella tundricola (strain ATCC BAA-1859 / DSM 23138 / MP5ACTX9) TaxID=1198114 RepID=E8WV63_GRATM|nr:pantoate--beta-alanine ligase [Granulicella tundricola]ADW67238.1 pantoate/beta-alanine ligase [Granulicella tundricola MP5ACTX9]